MTRYNRLVKIATGTVTRGTVVIDGQAFAEGERVTVISYDEGEPFQVTAEEKRLLLASMAQADAGEFVDAEQLLSDIDESN
jgi:hypothetical protein